VLFEHAVLFPHVFDDLELVAIDPARQGHEQNPQGTVSIMGRAYSAGGRLGYGSAEFSDSTGSR
jgi:hypothetical protein